VILLDTNVLSELMRPRPAPQVIAWVGGYPRSRLGVTTITEAEIFYGIELLPRGRRKDGLLAAAEAMFAEDFQGRVFPFASEAARAFAKIATRRLAQGKPISQLDAEIAAIAQTLGAALATRNVTDF
jgi:predicted nucleic acid-binding protein